MIRAPVCGMQIQEAEAYAVRHVGDGHVALCSAVCAAQFDAAPQRYMQLIGHAATVRHAGSTPLHRLMGFRSPTRSSSLTPSARAPLWRGWRSIRPGLEAFWRCWFGLAPLHCCVDARVLASGSTVWLVGCSSAMPVTIGMASSSRSREEVVRFASA